MAAFFTNVQVRMPVGGSDGFRDSLIRALRVEMARQGLEEIDADTGEADRTILIGPSEGGIWIPVYDELTEEQIPDDLKHLAQVLSRDLSTSAVGILVEDSDVLQMLLYQSGTFVDTFDSDPDYDTVIPAERRRPFLGHPVRWRDLLTKSASVEDLQTARKADQVFAENTLKEISGLLGMNFDHAAIGLRYLLRTDEGHDLTGFTRLAFHSPVQPPGPESGNLPRLDVGAAPPQTILKVGHAIGSDGNYIGAIAQNVGGQSRGLRIDVWGSALDNGLLNLTQAELNRHAESGEGTETVEVDLVPGESDRARVVEARLPHYVINPGATPVLDLLSQRNLPTVDRLVRARFQARITAMLKGRAVKPGVGELHLELTPLANPDQGQVMFTILVEVLPANA